MRMKHMQTVLRRGGVLAVLLLLAGTVLFGQNVPERIYYKFDVAGPSVANNASAPAGLNPAPVLGLTQGNVGQFGLALIGNGGSSSTNYVNTGWPVSLPNTGWTISFWVNNQPVNTSLYYLFGDPTAASFRCFIGGAAGAGNLLLRGGGLTDVNVPAVGPGPTVVHFVYTGTAVRYYKNGVYINQVTQPTVTIQGTTGPFKVGGYSTSTGQANGARMDEFRLYNRALSDAEITMTWNNMLPMLGTLQGTVINAFNRTPIGGATVSIPGGFTTTTLANGTYTMAAPAGVRDVTCSAPLFVTQVKQATIVANQTTTLNFALDPMPGTLTGIVTDASTGVPITGARIQATNPPFNTTVYSVFGGTYTLNVFPVGTFTVTCSKTGYDNIAGPFTFSQGVTITQNYPMLESANPPSNVIAALNTGQTAVDINWELPKGNYELLYDDGIAENFTEIGRAHV